MHYCVASYNYCDSMESHVDPISRSLEQLPDSIYICIVKEGLIYAVVFVCFVVVNTGSDVKFTFLFKG